MITQIYFRFDTSKKIIKLEAFAKLTQKVLLGFDHEVRESSNYDSGFYHSFKTKENKVRVTEADDIFFYDYHYAVSLYKEEENLNAKLMKLVEFWVNKGCIVSIPTGPSIDTTVRTYFLDKKGLISWKDHTDPESRKN
ncbi:hypothetical protein [Leptospira kmetyi]|uniref:hypothetical protein n=1 Tax=Leptospira kmetyi TaxID=408139 RepID=UPI0002886DC9|nr:hypothetical protein [Leptospira kmetyi]